MYLVQSSKNMDIYDEENYWDDGKYNFSIFKLKPIEHDYSVCRVYTFVAENDVILFRFKKK